jgi:YHS domain-containing protein
MPLGHGQPIRQPSGFGKLWKRVVGWLMVGGLCAATPAISGPASLGEALHKTNNDHMITQCPGNSCTPRVSTFGHHPTQWRSWPGERRPDRAFPQSIGLEAIPTPEPGPIPELPRQKISPQKPSLPPLPKLPTELPLTPPEEQSPTPPGAAQPPSLPSEKPFRIEERSPLEGIQPKPLEPIPLEPMPPGPAKPGVQMPLPLEPSPKPASPTPLPLEATPKPGSPTPVPLEPTSPPASQPPVPKEPMQKPATQLPLPLEPLPTEKPTGTVPKPEMPPKADATGPTGPSPPLPSVPQDSANRSAFPPLPAPEEKPAPTKPPAESGPEKPGPAEKSSGSVIPSVPQPEASSSGRLIEPVQPSGRFPAPGGQPNAISSPDGLSSSAPGLPPRSSAWGSPRADRPPSAELPAREPTAPRAPDLAPLSSEPMPSQSARLADPLEPWAEPKPWTPSQVGSDLGNRAPHTPLGPPAPEVPSAGLVPEAPAIEGRPSAVRAEAGLGAPDSPGPSPAAFQTDLPPPDRTGAGLPPAAPAGTYELEGYCPVSLLEKEQWVPGDPQFAVQYQGKIYLLAGPSQRQRFLANPHRYAPVGGGVDPVLAVEENRHVPGRTDYCVVYDGRLYLFSSAESLARFHQNPKKYASFAHSGL